MEESILFENARREIARLGGIVAPERKAAGEREVELTAMALPHSPLPHYPIASKR